MTKAYDTKRSGAKGHIPKAKVRAYYNRLTRVKENNGGVLRPRDVVEDAAIKSSPYHDYFEWDDSVAGEKFRIEQARELIAQIVEVVIVNKKPVKQRSFYSVIDKKNKETVYVTLKEVVKDDDNTDQLLLNLQGQLEGAAATISTIVRLRKEHKNK